MKCKYLLIVISKFPQCPEKQSHGKQLIHRHLSKTKSIGRSQDRESQAGRQSGSMVVCVQRGREGMRKRMNQDRICYLVVFSVIKMMDSIILPEILLAVHNNIIWPCWGWERF